MWRISFAALVTMLFLIAPVYGCEWTKSLHADNDLVEDTIIARTGTFNTCGSEIRWQDSFHRTSSENGAYYLRIKYVGSPVYNQYYYDNYSEGDYTNSGTNCTGQPVEIIIGKSSWGGGGLFSEITAQATFYNSCTPTMPPK